MKGLLSFGAFFRGLEYAPEVCSNHFGNHIHYSLSFREATIYINNQIFWSIQCLAVLCMFSGYSCCTAAWFMPYAVPRNGDGPHFCPLGSWRLIDWFSTTHFMGHPCFRPQCPTVRKVSPFHRLPSPGELWLTVWVNWWIALFGFAVNWLVNLWHFGIPNSQTS